MQLIICMLKCQFTFFQKAKVGETFIRIKISDIKVVHRHFDDSMSSLLSQLHQVYEISLSHERSAKILRFRFR